ncbi:MAG: hypothetical protein GXP53_01030 [Deltaproteobacteria bacterium]|nr:hypothetical protein [Deltaproteobacteria bacterium]
MKKSFFPDLIFITAIILLFPAHCPAAGNGSVHVNLQRPAGTLTMGDTPVFSGTVTNMGTKTSQGLVVYLSLVSLKTGKEHPVDLEDWSAQKAVRINRLAPGETNRQEWSMRLIQAGRFGIALTVVDPLENRPIISDLVHFDVQQKATVSSARILPVAAGEPLLLIVIFALFQWRRIRSRRE